MAVHHRHQAEVLFLDGFSTHGKLGSCCHRCCLGGLAAGVGVDPGVQNQDIDVAPGSENVVQATVADIVRPAVAADRPDALLDQVVRNQGQSLGFGAFDRLDRGLELDNSFPLGGNAGFIAHIRAQEGTDERISNIG